MSTIIQRLGRFVHGCLPEQLPPSVLLRVRLQHLNLAGAVRAVSDRPLAGVLAGEGAEARVRRSAALGSMLSMQDTLLGGQTGVGAVPVAWALSEGQTVESLLVAVALGNEVGGRVAASTLLGPSLGEGSPAVVRAAAATAAARLLGLSAAQCAHAIALAIDGAAGFSHPRGVLGDALRAGQHAADGLRAAQLARAGVCGDLGLLDDAEGPLSALCWLPLRAAFTGLGQAWLSETLAFSLQPLALHAQVPVQAVQEILRRHIKAADKRLRADQLDHIEIRTTALAAAAGLRSWPLAPTTVPHSLRHAVGILVTTNELTPAQLTGAWLSENRERIGSVAARIEIRHDPARTAAALGQLFEVLTPLLAGVTAREARQVSRRAADHLGALPSTGGAALARIRARPDRLLEKIRYSSGQLSDARLEELQLRADTEVKLFTTRGGSWPERRTIPEGSPGWSWGDTVSRVLSRHGAPDAEALYEASRTAPGAQWVASILGSST